eukprot:scaffold521_cov308-Prasinococcus_capsulatus_cf.AAC.4
MRQPLGRFADEGLLAPARGREPVRQRGRAPRAHAAAPSLPRGWMAAARRARGRAVTLRFPPPRLEPRACAGACCAGHTPNASRAVAAALSVFHSVVVLDDTAHPPADTPDQAPT